MSVSVSEKIALGGYPMQTTARCLLLITLGLVALSAEAGRAIGEWINRKVIK